MPIDSNFDEHGLKKPDPHADPKRDAEHPGYELTDVNTRGIVVFLAGLMGCLVVFFVLCYAMGKAINIGFVKQDTEETNLAPQPVTASGSPAVAYKREDMGDNPSMEQKESAIIAQSFKAPRIDSDDGDQGTADLHAKEDLLLEHYTSIDGKAGAVRIPIERAMELIAQKGLPQVAAAAQTTQPMFGDRVATVQTPLTDGFARTGYELEQIESRDQKMKFAHESAEQEHGK